MINQMKINEVRQFFITAVKRMIDEGSTSKKAVIKGSLLTLCDANEFKKLSKKNYDYSFTVQFEDRIFVDILNEIYHWLSIEKIRQFESYRMTLLDKDDYVNYNIEHLVLKEVMRQHPCQYEAIIDEFAKRLFVDFSRTDEYQSIIRDEKVETFENLLQCLPIPIMRKFFYKVASQRDIVEGMLYLARLQGLKITCEKEKK